MNVLVGVTVRPPASQLVKRSCSSGGSAADAPVPLPRQQQQGKQWQCDGAPDDGGSSVDEVLLVDLQQEGQRGTNDSVFTSWLGCCWS